MWFLKKNTPIRFPDDCEDCAEILEALETIGNETHLDEMIIGF